MLADRTVQLLTAEAGFGRDQVTLIEPDDTHLARKLEPETRAIGARVATVHLSLGIAGLLVGLGSAWLLIHLGPPLARSSP
jgi:hypothetical protein